MADVVQEGQAYAWNPSIIGAKSEDTFLVGQAGNDVLTTIPGWPMIAVELPGEKDPILRPGTLQVT
jgi:antitoxin VapB